MSQNMGHCTASRLHLTFIFLSPSLHWTSYPWSQRTTRHFGSIMPINSFLTEHPVRHHYNLQRKVIPTFISCKSFTYALSNQVLPPLCLARHLAVLHAVLGPIIFVNPFLAEYSITHSMTNTPWSVPLLLSKYILYIIHHVDGQN